MTEITNKLKEMKDALGIFIDRGVYIIDLIGDVETLLAGEPVPVEPPVVPFPINLDTVKVIVGKAPLREIYNHNKKGFPVWGIYNRSNISERIVAKNGKVLQIVGDAVKGDGNNYAYPLYSGQIVDGKYLPDNQRLYVLKSMVVRE